MIPLPALLAALAAAGAAVTALHLRSRPRRGAAPFPSFQHLEGLAPRRRPAWPIEQPIRLLLRLLALAFAAAALLLARRESVRTLVLAVEPGAVAWPGAQEIVSRAGGPAVALTFDGEKPVVEASPRALEAAERARRALASCSATYRACLVRAAGEIGGDTVVVSRVFSEADGLESLGTFRFSRQEAPNAAREGAPSAAREGAASAAREGASNATREGATSAPRDGAASPAPDAHPAVLRGGDSAAVRIWAAALEAAASSAPFASSPPNVPPLIVAESATAAEAASAVVLVPVTAPGPLARAVKVGAVPLDGDAALAAGVRALELGSSLALTPETSSQALVAPVLVRRGATIFAAATDEDLGRWAHGPTLAALARIVLFEAGRNLELGEPPAGGRQRWKGVPDADRLGLADVAPGRYEREDGRVAVTVVRDAAAGAPLADAALTARGGTLVTALPRPPAPSRAPLALLLAALALRLADAPRVRRERAARDEASRAAALPPRSVSTMSAVASSRAPLATIAVFVACVAVLAVLAVDGSFVVKRPVRRVVAVEGRLSLSGAVRDASCTRPGAALPCAITARAAFANEAALANAVVFRADRPRVTLASWELPAEIPAGEAGLLRATLDVRRAAGREVTLSVRPTSGAAAEASRAIASAREVVTLSLPVRTAAEGVSFALVKAGVGEDADALVIPVVTRARERRRLVLAAAPGWEARAAGEALARRGAVERITRVGASAVLRRIEGDAPVAPSSMSSPTAVKSAMPTTATSSSPRITDARGAAVSAAAAPPDPLERLKGDLSKLDLIALAGFTSEELAGAGEAALLRHLRAGGALLFLGEPPRLATIPLPSVAVQRSGAPAETETTLPSPRTGEIGASKVSFLGFPAWPVSLPAAGAVLGRLDGAPWIVGRHVGAGRVAALAAPDAWRLGTGYDAVLGDLVAWLEAGRGGTAAVLAPDLRSLEIGGARVDVGGGGLTSAVRSLRLDSAPGVAPVPSTDLLSIESIDPVDPFTLLPPGLARARVLARRAHTPFLEAETPAELTSLLARYPTPPPLPRRTAWRDVGTLWLALAGLLTVEVWLRRRAA